MFNREVVFNRDKAPDNWVFALSGFRSFDAFQAFEFSQVAFVTGGNHTGKSTILRALSILLDTVREGGFRLRLNGRNSLMHQIPSLDQLVPWGISEHAEHEIGMVARIGSIQLDLAFERINQVNEAWMRYAAISFYDDDKKIELLSLEWGDWDKDSVPIEWDKSKWKLRMHKMVFGRDFGVSVRALDRFTYLTNYHSASKPSDKKLEDWYDLFVRDGRKKTGNYRTQRIDGLTSFAGLRSKLAMEFMTNTDGKKDKQDKIFDAWMAGEALGAFVKSLPFMRHLGSQREVAPRVATFGTSPYRIFKEVHQLIVHRQFAKGSAFMMRWLSELNIAEEYEINNVSGLGFSVRLKKCGGSSRANWCNLADLSMGEAQIFRILLTLAQAINEVEYSGKWGICVLEEPDSNLHPSTQSALLDAVIAAVNESPLLQVFMETHSEILVRSLQLKVKDGSLRKDAVMINYLEGGEEGDINHKRILLDSNGRTSEDFGAGFIDQSGELAFKLM